MKCTDKFEGKDSLKGPVLAIMLHAPLLLFWFSKSSVLATKKRLRIFNITKMATKRLQHAMLNGQYRVFLWVVDRNLSLDV